MWVIQSQLNTNYYLAYDQFADLCEWVEFPNTCILGFDSEEDAMKYLSKVSSMTTRGWKGKAVYNK